MTNFIPRAVNYTADQESKRFEAQLCGCCIITSTEVEAVKLAPASVPTVFRNIVEGDCVVLAIDASGYYGTPRLRLDNKFKDNKAFEWTPRFTLAELLEDACDEAGEIKPEKAMAFAKKLKEKYKETKNKGKTSILNALLKK